MEILNSTVYNSQDLHDLIVAIHERCTESHDEMVAMNKAKHVAAGQPFDETRPWFQASPLPAQFQIGYYNRKPDGNWASLQGRYRSDCPRLGIARLEQMPIPVMSVLAESATLDSSQEEGIPQKQKIALICKIQQCFRGECNAVETANAHKVRFTGDVSKKAAKKASRDGRVARLEQRLARQNTVVSQIEVSLTKAIVERDALIEKIHKLDPSAGMRMCV